MSRFCLTDVTHLKKKKKNLLESINLCNQNHLKFIFSFTGRPSLFDLYNLRAIIQSPTELLMKLFGNESMDYADVG